MPKEGNQGIDSAQANKPINPEVLYRKDELGLVLKLKKAEELGLEMTRGDNIETIIKEAEALGTIKEIAIDGNRSLMIFTTVAASAHTPYVCQYQVFKDIWFKMTKKTGYQPSSDKPLLAVKDEGNAFIPLHLITWACVKTKNDQGKDVYHELDIFDLVGQGRRYDKERDFTLADLDEAAREKILSAFWEEIERRMVVHNGILSEMYQKDVLPRISTAITSSGLPENLKTGLIELFKKPGFPDNTVPIGHYSRYQQDKLGRGPQSVPAFHSHSAMYFLPEKIWDFIKQLPDKTDQEKDELFNQVLEIINPALGGGEVKWLAELAEEDEKIKKRVPELMMKQVDPYSTAIFIAGRFFIKEKIENLCQDLGDTNVELFFHHTNDERKGDMRFAEGLKIEIKGDGREQRLVHLLTRVNQALKDIYQLWFLSLKAVSYKLRNYKVYQEFLGYLSDLGVDDHRIYDLIDRIIPVGGDLYMRPDKIYAEFARRQLKGEIKKDEMIYNIPGIFSAIITIEFTDNQINVYFGPVANKGGAEQSGGNPVIR